MKQDKLSNIIEGAILAVLGVLIAIYGAGTVIDAYFGVAGIIAGASLAGIAIFLISKKAPLSFPLVFLSVALITCSIGLFTHFISVMAFEALMVLIVLALGVAGVLYGIYALIKGAVPFGIAFILFGATCATLAGLYMGIPDFRTAFWIVAGIMMAVFGVLTIVFAIVKKK